MLNFAYNQMQPVAMLEMGKAMAVEHERQIRFKKAWSAYQKGLPKPLLPLPEGIDDNVVLSYPRLTVDKGVAALFGEETCFWTEEKFPLDDEKKPILPPEQEYLDAVWKQNKKMTLLNCGGINGGVFGHVFYKVFEQPGLPYLRIVDVTPEQMNVFWNPEDIADVWEYHQTWGGIDPRTGKPKAFRHRTIKQDAALPEYVTWTIVKEQQTEPDTRWVETGRVNWPYSWSPVFHCQNLLNPSEFWGLADIEPDILSINHAVNFIASNLNRTLYYYTDPKLVGKGFEADAINTAIGNMIILPSPDAALDKIEMDSDYAGAQNFFDRMKDAYDECTRVPAVARGKVENAGQLSGVAMRILYGPLLEKTATKQMLYGDMFIEMNKRLCEYGKVTVPENIYIKWGNAMPSDELAEAQAYEIHQRLGVSTQTILDKLGYDAETEMSQRGEEDDAAMERTIQTEQATMAANFSRGV
jgi:hypothetical protein